MLAIRGKRVSEAENFTNLEMSKITEWVKNNKINFNNEEKSKTMLTYCLLDGLLIKYHHFPDF